MLLAIILIFVVRLAQPEGVCPGKNHDNTMNIEPTQMGKEADFKANGEYT